MTAPSSEHVIVPPRFRGPPGSGNGGYVAGLVAALVQGGADSTDGADDPAVEVSLLRPPPLDEPLEVRRTPDGVVVGPEDSPVARGLRVPDLLDDVDPVDLDVAVAASANFPGHRYHPFPTCFGCGTERPDGLRIFPGPVADGRVAAAWTPAADLAANFHEYDDPTPRVAPAITWAALDCIGGWSTDLGDRLVVLARMTAVLDTLPVIGEPHVVIGQRMSGALDNDGRKSTALTTLYDSDGRIVARASQLWVGVDPSSFAIAAKAPGNDA